MLRITQTAVLLALLIFAACTKGTPVEQHEAAAQPSKQTYRVRGILRSVNFADNSVTVEHEAVPGYMPGMTMPFDVKEMAEVQPLKVGDGMDFQLVVTDKTSWIENVRQIDASTVKIAPKRTAIVANASSVERVKEEDALPAFQLVDQNGQPITAETFRGHPLFLTFIFTRCPLPNFCPLMSRNFQEIQEALSGDAALASSVRYLSISFDPQFDKPEVLMQYAKQYRADASDWRFATGAPEEIKKLTQSFSVYVQPEQGTISHSLATALIGPDGVIRKIFRGNSWRPSEAVAAVKELAAN
jgi:protein SCO1/2